MVKKPNTSLKVQY